MKTNSEAILKTLKIFSMLLFALLIGANIQAQKTETIYYYIDAAGLIGDEGLKAIVTNVKSIRCDIASHTLAMAIQNQFHDHLNADYRYPYKYDSVIAFTYKSRAEAETERREKIGYYKTEGYYVNRDIYFQFYCD